MDGSDESLVYDIKWIYLQLENALQFRLCRITEIEDFFIVEVNNKEKMRNILSKSITALNYTDKTLMVLSGANSGASFSLFTTVIDLPGGTASLSISLVFLVSKCFVKNVFEINGKKKANTEK